MVNQGIPSHEGETADVNSHPLRAIDGQFHPLVWECQRCLETRHRARYFEKFDCEQPAVKAGGGA